MSKSTGTQQLTPYDTGARLEPHPWVQSPSAAPMPRDPASELATADDFGRVDFDDEESRAVLTVYVARTEAGHVLHIDNLVETALSITGDTEAIVLGVEHQAGIAELLELAERGRRAFEQEAERGTIDQADQDDATLRWVTAHNAAVAIRRQQAC